MYLPFLRGKQYELYTLRDLSETIIDSGQVLPIIEPVNTSVHSRNCFTRYAQERMPFILLTNPQHGTLRGEPNGVQSHYIDRYLKGYDDYHIGYTITPRTTGAELERFLDSYSDRQVCLIHRTQFKDPQRCIELSAEHGNVAYHVFIHEKSADPSYHREFLPQPIALIHDGFSLAVRNADYPDDEHFSNLVNRHRILKYKAFGDFLTVGDHHKDQNGGPAKAVALHLTYPTDNGLRIRHFVSDTNHTTVNVAGKFSEALTKLVDYLAANPDVDNTMGCEIFRDLHTRGHFPNLGPAKQYSMMHHIEQMIDLI